MSNSNHSHHSSSERKGTKFARNFLAFILFVSILVLSFSLCTGFVFLNADRVSEIFTNNTYVTAFRQDVLQYAEDLCDEAYIPYDSVEQELTYDVIYDIATSYAGGNLCNDEMYTDTTYQSRINDLQNNLTASTQEMLKSYELDFDKADVEDFSSRVCKYVKEKTEFAYLDYLKKTTNIGRTAAIAAGVVSVIFVLVTALIIFYTGKRRYRSIRAITYSLTASSLFQLLMVIAFEVFKKFKTLVIYPVYLCESVMGFVGRCEITVLISAVISFIPALIFMVFVWRFKRNEK